MTGARVASRWSRALIGAFLLLLVLAEQSQAQTTTQSGILTVVWGDAQFGALPPTIAWSLLRDDGSSSDIVIAPDDLTRAGGVMALNGRRVSITGRELPAGGGGATTRPRIEATSVQPLTSIMAAPSVLGVPQLGNKPYALILCKFSDVAAEPTPAGGYTQMMSNSYPNLDHYFREISAGQMNMAGTQVFGWFVLPGTHASYVTAGGPDHFRLAFDCTAAANATVDFSQFFGIVTQFNRDLAQTGAGSAWGGTQFLTLDGQAKSWPFTWMPTWAHYGVYAHEIGHSLGLPHSSGPYSETYDSMWDVMSNPWLVNFNGGEVGAHTIIYHKDLLGWIPASRKILTTGPAVQAMTLEQAEFPVGGTNPLMVRIPIPGTNTFYTVESRRLLGYDIPLPGEAVVLHKVTPGASSPARVVDVDGNGNPNDAAAMWLAGETFDDGNGIKVQIGARTADGWTIVVTPGNILTVDANGEGSGLITTQPGLSPSISCTATAGEISGTCVAAYYGQQQVTLTAAPQAGSVFAGWSGGCTGTGVCSPPVNQASSVIANFATGGGQCTVTASSTPAAGGSASVTAGGATGTCGRSVTLTATPNAGWFFLNWTEGGVQQSANAAFTFTLNSNRALVANFAQQCAVNLSASPAGGGNAAVTAGGSSGSCGRSVTVTATPNAGWDFIDWTEGGVPQSASAAFTFTIASNRALVANFQQQCAVSVSSNPAGGGTANVTAGGTSGECGRSVTLTAIPNSGWIFLDWTEGGVQQSTSASFTFAIASNRVLAANFQQQCALTLSANPVAGGTAAITVGAGTGACGRTVTIQATPGANYSFLSWSDGVTTNPRSIVVSVPAQTLSAEFQQQCALSVSTNPVAGGNANVTAGEVTGACGRSVTVAATPSPGWNFINWTEGGVQQATNASFTFTLGSDRALVANFQQQCAVTLSANPITGGNVAIAAGTATGACGRAITVTATPTPGWSFTNWTSGITVESTIASYSFAPTADLHLVANFELQCSVTLTPSPAAGGSASLSPGSATGACGRTVGLMAIPALGWNFIEWTEGTTQLSTNPIFNTTIASDRSVVAVFAQANLLGNRILSFVLGLSGDLTPGEKQSLDAAGNNNGRVDLGDLLAWMDRNPTVALNPQLSAAARALVKVDTLQIRRQR